jgi:uncharacterized membrane protein YedE/YeeE
MEKPFTLAAGLLFGAGVTLSGMVNPARVLNFFDVAGPWDPTLLFVMSGALLVTLLGYRIIFRRQRPLFAEGFALPTATRIDAALVCGAALFGIGWGLSGFCPGPAVAGLVFGFPTTALFVVAMAVGALVFKLAARLTGTSR